MATAALIANPTRTRVRRPSRGSARQVRPVTQPVTAIRGPQVRKTQLAGVRSCRDAGVVPVRDLDVQWRLTSRGIAVIMVVGLLIAAAALTVIGATVLRVTSDDYRPTAHSAVR